MSGACNYGAVLQSFALFKYLKNNNLDVQIIDYRPYYVTQEYDGLFYFTSGKLDIKKSINNIISFVPRKIKKIKFIKFLRENVTMTSKQYRNYEDLKNNPPESDCYIAGSDQIWNSDISFGIDPAFFLNFVQSGKKVSYAASMGHAQIPTQDQKFFKKYLKHFNAISVREKTAQKNLEAMGIKNIELTMDPALLLSKEEYMKIAVLPKYENYLFIYSLGYNKTIELLASYIAQKLNLRIVSIAGFRNNYTCDHRIRFAGPKEFLGYMAKASYVLTDSFHGTVFSIIFNKSFSTVISILKRGSRIESLLTAAGLYDRIANIENMEQLLKPIDYSQANSLLSKHIDDSKSFLQKNISL
jgi:hypothetical protein